MVNFMKQDNWSRRLPEFREYINLIDKQRNLSFIDTFPEMKDVLLGRDGDIQE